jgi:N-acetylneuraminic acid mutarotase
MEIFLCRYAVGGHDGNGMVSSVEIFDPRVGSWMMGESLNDSRAYAGAAVIADSIYVIGGVNKNQGILDTVCKCILIGSSFRKFEWA